MDEGSYVVYKHTNIENGLVYYGIAENYETRWSNGMGYQSNAYFWADIVKYGWKNFRHEIMFENLSRERALFYEGMLIQETESYLPENGYNQNMGRRMEYKEIVIDADNNVIEQRRKRPGRSGTPVYYDGKVFLTIREFCDEYSEDTLAVSQMLSPNCARKIPFRLADKGLRYATDEEVANKLREQESSY